MTLTIGELIDKLKACDQESFCLFDFGRFAPTNVSSWRGIYAQAAIGYARANRDISYRVKDVIGRLNEGVGCVHSGWKGGEYYYDHNTPIWVDNTGECSETAIADVTSDGCTVYIETRHEACC